MTKSEQNPVLAWRLKLLHEVSVMPRNVAQTCRHFGLSRKTFYKWKARHRAHGEAGLLDHPRVPHRSPRATPREVVSKILYLRQRYHFGAGRIAAYLRRFHGLSVACS
jgi:transposase-like protein